MTVRRSKLSAISQPADRGVSSAYFLNDVVPLVVLGVVLDRYVLSGLAGRVDGYQVFGHVWVLGLFSSLSVLSLGCFPPRVKAPWGFVTS